MRALTGLILALLLACATAPLARAQAPESIWLAVNTTSYKAGETVIATVNAQSGTRIQGFTFQIRYDPACLKPIHAASPISGMNGLQLPQTMGLVDASFASTVPQNANGTLAEVRLLSLASCQTQLVLESAALAVRNASGFAAPVAGIVLGAKTVALDIGPGAAPVQPTQPVIGTPLPLGVEGASQPNYLKWGLIALLVVLVADAALFGLLGLFRKKSNTSH